MDVRPARYADTERILDIDPEARSNRAHLNFINQVVTSRNCYVAVEDGAIRGYVVLEYTFFGHGIVTRIFVDPAQRRRGVGTALLRHVEEACTTPKLFATAPESSAELRGFFEALELQPSGTIDNLEEELPTYVYFALSAEGRWGRRRG